MVIIYENLKKYDEIKLMKNKMNLNNQKIMKHPS